MAASIPHSRPAPFKIQLGASSFSSSWSGLTQVKGHPHRQGHPRLGERAEGREQTPHVQDTLRCLLKVVPCPCSSGDSREREATIGKVNGMPWAARGSIVAGGSHTQLLPWSQHCLLAPIPSLPFPLVSDVPSSPGPTPGTCLGERSNALGQLCFHLRQRLCLSHCLLQLLLRQLQQLLQVPSLLLALWDSRVTAQYVPPQHPLLTPMSPGQGDTRRSSVPGGAGTPCWPTHSPVCH